MELHKTGADSSTAIFTYNFAAVSPFPQHNNLPYNLCLHTYAAVQWISKESNTVSSVTFYEYPSHTNVHKTEWPVLITSDSTTPSTSWEANSSSDSREITISWHMKVHYCLYNSLSLVQILSHMNPGHDISILFL